MSQKYNCYRLCGMKLFCAAVCCKKKYGSKKNAAVYKDSFLVLTEIGFQLFAP